MACSLIESYLQRESIDSYMLAVIGKNCVKVAELFYVKNIKSITKEEMDSLLKAWEFLGTNKMRLKPLLYWGWRTKRYLYADNYAQISFNEMFQYDVFEFPELIERKKIDCNNGSRYAEQLFKKLSLKKGKTVILAPYAGSFVSEMKIEEWEQLARTLSSLGYSVCTNSCGETEPIIKGTIPIFFPYAEAINVLEYGGGFIALRSGLCDIVSQAKCKMIILYESTFSAARYDFFSLKKMRLSESVHELIYSDDIIDRILSFWM